MSDLNGVKLYLLPFEDARSVVSSNQSGQALAGTAGVRSRVESRIALFQSLKFNLAVLEKIGLNARSFCDADQIALVSRIEWVLKVTRRWVRVYERDIPVPGIGQATRDREPGDDEP